MTPEPTMTMLQGERCTVVRLEIWVQHRHYTVLGEAKRHPRDHDYPYIGEAYALSRAFGKLSRALEVDADTYVSTLNP